MRSSYPYYNGYVIVEDYMGDDLNVVNAAKVSFKKRSTQIGEPEKKLLRYLAEHHHMSPFRHVQVSLSLQDVPEVVLRQAYKHQVGCGYSEFKEVATVWNEVSGRYVEFEENYFYPDNFRKQHKSNKQASDPNVLVEDQEEIQQLYMESIARSHGAYKKLIEKGVCKEQARFLMPLAFCSSVYWTASLEALVHFVKLRDHPGAQIEIKKLAEIIKEIILDLYPHSTQALLEN